MLDAITWIETNSPKTRIILMPKAVTTFNPKLFKFKYDLKSWIKIYESNWLTLYNF